MTIAEIEKTLGLSLPDSYKELVAGIGDFLYIFFNEYKEKYPDDEGTPWFFGGKED